MSRVRQYYFQSNLGGSGYETGLSATEDVWSGFYGQQLNSGLNFISPFENMEIGTGSGNLVGRHFRPLHWKLRVEITVKEADTATWVPVAHTFRLIGFVVKNLGRDGSGHNMAAYCNALFRSYDKSQISPLGQLKTHIEDIADVWWDEIVEVPVVNYQNSDATPLLFSARGSKVFEAEALFDHIVSVTDSATKVWDTSVYAVTKYSQLSYVTEGDIVFMVIPNSARGGFQGNNVADNTYIYGCTYESSLSYYDH